MKTFVRYIAHPEFSYWDFAGICLASALGLPWLLWILVVLAWMLLGFWLAKKVV